MRPNPLSRLNSIERQLKLLIPDVLPETQQSLFQKLSLLKFIPAVSPTLEAPRHLAPILAVLEKIRKGKPQRFTFSCPPRHGKSETLAHFAALYLLNHPEKKIIYATYAEKLAAKFSRNVKRIATKVGVRISHNLDQSAHWETTAGGGVLATGIAGGATGFGCDLLIIDDIHKDRAQAESGLIRQNIMEWFDSTILPRLEPNGSCVVVATRWNPEDLIGTLISQGWDHIRLPAIDENGKALWDKRPLSYLMQFKERNEFEWNALYQGNPQPKGGALFHGAYGVYRSLKEEFQHIAIQLPGIAPLPPNLRISIGVDFAYSAKTRSDYSVAVVLGECDGLFYVLDVVRAQCEAPKFGAMLAPLAQKYGSSQINSYIFGTEKGVMDFIKSNFQLKLNAKQARGDKFSRSQGLAAAWNAGKVLLPQSAEWLNCFVSELLAFTGNNDRHDDQVDAAVAAFDFLAKAPLARGVISQPIIPF